jgi:diguanylate cyclase (GGDEF)-like protein/PAS domain S-box-containing protein
MTRAEQTAPVPSRPHSAQLEGRFRHAFEHSASAIALIEGRGAGAGRFLEVNPALVKVSGYSAAQLLGMSYCELLHPDEVDAIRAGVNDLIAGRKSSLHSERRLIAADGSIRWIAFSVSLIRDERGRPVSAIAHAQDVTERKHAELELRHMADHDPLTGLFNRRRFESELERELRSSRNGPGAAMLVLDLDRFKAVNDSCGHAAGDELLVEVAIALRGRLRDTDIVARLGGDEFGIILPRADERRAALVAEQLRAAVYELAIAHGTRVTASVGVCRFGGAGGGAAAERVVADADAAMYLAKQGGRDRVGLAGAGSRITAYGRRRRGSGPA